MSSPLPKTTEMKSTVTVGTIDKPGGGTDPDPEGDKSVKVGAAERKTMETGRATEYHTR